MINLKNLTSIFEDHKLTDDQLEELQKADCIRILYLWEKGR